MGWTDGRPTGAWGHARRLVPALIALLAGAVLAVVAFADIRDERAASGFSGQPGQAVGGTLATFSSCTYEASGLGGSDSEFRASVRWGDGGGFEPVGLRGTQVNDRACSDFDRTDYVVSGNHTYAAPGTYTITIQITNVRAAADNRTLTTTATISGGTSSSTGTTTSTTATTQPSTSTTTVTSTTTTTQTGTTTTTPQAPTAAFTVTWPELSPGVKKSVIRPGQEVTFDAAGSSDPNGTITKFSWDVDGTDGFELESGSPTTKRTYTQAGNVKATLLVTDNEGLTSQALAQVRVRDNQPPTALAGAPLVPRPPNARPQTSGFSLAGAIGSAAAEANDPGSREFAPVVNKPYAFTGAPSVDLDGSVTEYRWALDVDGVYTPWSADPEIEHVFRAPGKRTIRLQVRDDEGAVDTWENEIDIPKPVYSVKLQTPAGKPVQSVTLKPGGSQVTVDGVANVTNNGTPPPLPQVFRADGTSNASGITVTVTPGASAGTARVVLKSLTGTPYLEHKLRFEFQVPIPRPGSTDAAPQIEFQRFTRTLTVLSVPATQLAVNGLEPVQAAQKYDGVGLFQSVGVHGDPMTYNGVRLAQDKSTYVRLYAVNLHDQAIPGVTAVLHATRDGKPLAGSPLTPFSKPKGGTVQPGVPTGTLEQFDDTDGSFWFRLPESWTKRNTTIRLRGVITPPYDEATTVTSCPPGGCAADNDLSVKGVSFRPTPKIKIRYLYLERDGKRPEAPGDDVIRGAGTYPIDPLLMEVQPYSLVTDASDVQGDEDETLMHKLHKISREVSEDRTDDPRLHPHGVVVGVADVPKGRSLATLALPAETPGTMTLADGAAFGHELGHVFAQSHASGCVERDGKKQIAPPFDDVYPVADWPHDQMGYLQGYAYPRLREAPFVSLKDAPPSVLRSAFEASPPTYEHDLMSYCGSVYGSLSPRNWSLVSLILEQLETKKFVPIDESAFTPPLGTIRTGGHTHLHGKGAAPVLYERGARAGAAQVGGASIGVLGTVRKDGALVGLDTFPLKPGHPVVKAPAGNYAAVARAADGSVVGRAPVEVSDDTTHDGPATSQLRAIVPSAGAATIEIQRDGVTIGSIAASPTPPTVRILSPKPGAPLPRTGSLKVRLAVTDPDGKPVTAKVDWSADGRRYDLLAMDDLAPGTAEIRVPAASFAGARSGVLRARVDDGFRTAQASVPRLRAPGRAPTIRLATPTVRVPAGTPVSLRAAALDDRGASLTGKRLRWRIGRRQVGTGTSVTVRDLRAGSYVATVIATDARGRRTAKRLSVRVQAVAPQFIVLRVPTKASRRARTISVRIATTIPAKLVAGGKRFATSRRSRTFKIPVKRGSSPARLTLTLRSGSKQLKVRRVVRR